MVLLRELLGLGLKPESLAFSHLALRAGVMFFAALLMLRLSHKRFFARRSALDVLLTFILASTLARAINGSAPFLETIAAGFVIVALHRAVAWLAVRMPVVERGVKGVPTPLIERGVVQRDALRRHDLSEDDLREDLRLDGVSDATQVRRAQLERNGEISIER